MSDYWQAELVPEGWLQGPGIPRARFRSLLLGGRGPVPDTVGYRVWGVLKFAFSC